MPVPFRVGECLRRCALSAALAILCLGLTAQAARSDGPADDSLPYSAQISALESVPATFWNCLADPGAAGCAPSAAAANVHPEPFAMSSQPNSGDELSAKWMEASERIAADIQTVTECQAQPANCKSHAARRLLSIVDAARKERGLVRLGTVNQAVNLAIRAVSDIVQYGVSDYWASPLESIGHRAGDCEDYAIAKYAALRLLGVAEDDLRLVVVRNLWRRENHAVLAVFFDGSWRLLDNLTMAMVDPSLSTRYEPLVSFGRSSGAAIAYRYEHPQDAPVTVASR